MTQKEEALQRAVKQALENCSSFYEKGRELNVSEVSDINLSQCDWYPTDKVDISNLEDCTGGCYRGSCRLKIGKENGIPKESCYDVTVSFTSQYDNSTKEFTVEITRVTANAK